MVPRRLPPPPPHMSFIFWETKKSGESNLIPFCTFFHQHPQMLWWSVAGKNQERVIWFLFVHFFTNTPRCCDDLWRAIANFRLRMRSFIWFLVKILEMAEQPKVAKVDKNNHEGGDEQSGTCLIIPCFCRFFITTESLGTDCYWYVLTEAVTCTLFAECRTEHVKCSLIWHLFCLILNLVVVCNKQRYKRFVLF